MIINTTDRNESGICILGAGVTGLACGIATGFPIYERNGYSGGICSSYYLEGTGSPRNVSRRKDEEDFRFEYGGGHWIFGGNEAMLALLGSWDTLHRYDRISSVRLAGIDRSVPYPIQNNLRYLDAAMADAIVDEIRRAGPVRPGISMHEWCETVFGSTLSALFFHPFHDLYTAGLSATIQPQDGYKSPVDIGHIIDGAKRDVASVGYNVSFAYPEHGLGMLTQKMEAACTVNFGREIVRIDTDHRRLEFADGTHVPYSRLISTLPLNRMQDLTGIRTHSEQDPYTSVLVVNVGAERGPSCPDDQWVYFPDSRSGFHRVGCYHNVHENFLPRSKRDGGHASLYVEKAYRGGHGVSAAEKESFIAEMIDELRAIGYIGGVDVIDPTWIDVAYTWTHTGSAWREEMLAALPECGILPVGRYATWKFQGILDSIQDGISVGSRLSSLKG